MSVTTQTLEATHALQVMGARPANRRLLWALLGCLVLLVIASGASIVLGARPTPLPAILEALNPHANSPETAVIASRATRTFIGLLAGAALGLAGTAMQGFTRNPLADPGIFGINAGAALGIVIAITALRVDQAYLWFGLLGAAVAATIVYALGQRASRSNGPLSIAIVGAVLSSGLFSILTAILLTHQEAMNLFRQWHVGSLAGRSTEHILAVAPILLIGALLVLASGRWLNAWALGEALSRGLGHRHNRSQLVVGTGIVFLCAGATALAGPIAFLGLLVPHALRPLIGGDYQRLAPAALIVAPALLLAADTLGRLILPPGEVPAGVMIALLGAPVFIAVARRARMGGP